MARCHKGEVLTGLADFSRATSTPFPSSAYKQFRDQNQIFSGVDYHRCG